MRRLLSRLCGSLTTKTRQVRRTKKAQPHLAVEALEDRSVPATLQVVSGLLTYDAGIGIGNNLSVSLSSSTYTFRDTAETISVLGIPGATGSGTNTVTVPAAAVPSAGMLINLGDRNDLVNIESTHDAISVKAGTENDTIDFGKVGGTVADILALVSVDGELGTDTVRVNDTSGGGTYKITDTQVMRGGFTMSYAGAESLTVNSGLFSDDFNVLSTAATVRTTLNGGTGNETFNVGNTAGTLDDIKGVLTLVGGPNGSAFQDAVNLRDQGSTVSHSYTVRDNSVARSGANTIIYSEMEQLTLNAGSAADSVGVLFTAAGTPVTLNLGAGNDGVTLGTTGSSLDNILAPVTVNGDAGADAVVLNDVATTRNNFYYVSATDVTYGILGLTKLVNYNTAESLTLNAGASNDYVSVLSTSASTPVTLRMGAGDDYVQVMGSSGTLDPILGAVTADGQLGSDQLFIDDRGSVTQILNDTGTGFLSVDYTVTATTVSRTRAASIGYAGTETLTLNTAAQPIFFIQPFQAFDSSPNDVVVKGTSAATTVNVGSVGNFVATVGSDANSLDGIQGALSVNSQGAVNSMVLKDQGDANANSYTISSTSVDRVGSASISYSLPASFGTPSSLTLNAGAFNDTVSVKSSAASTPLTLNMGAGNDTVTLGGNLFTRLGGIASTVSVNGGAGADAIVLNDVDAGILPIAGSNFGIDSQFVSRDGHIILDYFAAESLALNAGGGNDTIHVGSTATVSVVVRAGFGDDVLQVGGPLPFGLAAPVTLDGQSGSDTLDYSSYVFGVRVNLALGTATGAAGGVSNIENVTGSQANDILVGDDQANILRGGPGRDILIGRGGADQLFGEDGDDILIGASTAYDLNAAALESLMAEWGRTDLFGTAQQQYQTRINHLLGVFGGGLNGTTLLNLSQVTDDGAADYQDGGAGLDWYFHFAGDTSLVELGERVN